MEPPPTEIVKGRARQAIRQLRVARKYSQEMRQQRNSWDTASYEMEKYADAEVALMTSIMSPKMRDSEIKADALRRSGESYDELQHRTRQPLPTDQWILCQPRQATKTWRAAHVRAVPTN